MAPPKGLAQSEFMEYVKFGSLELFRLYLLCPISELFTVCFFGFLIHLGDLC